MLEIKPQETIDARLIVPGSKSYSHRILIASALSDGVCEISNCLKSEDTLLTMKSLRMMGVRMDEENETIRVFGSKGVLSPCDEPVYLANAGTSMRLLTAVAALGQGKYTLTGTDRMSRRPIDDLLDALCDIGVPARSVNGTGCPPVEITGGKVKGGSVELKCAVSSQYLSALLLIAPYTQEGLDIRITEGPVSKPYIDLTVDVMKRLGVVVEREGNEKFKVPGGQVYKAGDYLVETDCSNASYFFAAAAITGGTVKVGGISKDSRQGDLRLVDLLEEMGCRVIREDDGITVSGGPLTAIDADMADIPDVVPTLAVTAAFAKGETTIRNVGHLRAKECDRLDAVATELSKMGIETVCSETSINIKGGKAHGAEIDTYDDHRIAMCFSVAGLMVPGIRIRDEKCVEKSFPNYWDVFNGLYKT